MQVSGMACRPQPVASDAPGTWNWLHGAELAGPVPGLPAQATRSEMTLMVSESIPHLHRCPEAFDLKHLLSTDYVAGVN